MGMVKVGKYSVIYYMDAMGYDSGKTGECHLFVWELFGNDMTYHKRFEWKIPGFVGEFLFLTLVVKHDQSIDEPWMAMGFSQPKQRSCCLLFWDLQTWLVWRCQGFSLEGAFFVAWNPIYTELRMTSMDHKLWSRISSQRLMCQKSE